MPDYTGGRLDPEGGIGKRLRDRERFRWLLLRMRLPVLLTLTINRSGFSGPQDGYRKAMRYVSKLLSSRLGIAVWARVVEVQTASGDGWIHWHIVADVAGTRYEQPGPRPVDLSSLSTDIWQYWRDQWGIGGCDVELVRSRESTPGYLSKYIVKPWPGIPRWILLRTIFRIVGFSKPAGAMLRAAGLSSERSAVTKNKTRKKRPVRPLIDRLAASGLVCKVIQPTRGYVGHLAAPAVVLLGLAKAGQFGLRIVPRTFQNARGCVTRVQCVLDDASQRLVRQINRDLMARGIVEVIRDIAAWRRKALWESWDELQALQTVPVETTDPDVNQTPQSR